MIHSINGWNFARSPNYVTNVDKLYPYSEVPFIGNYKLVKIPTPPGKEPVEHVDYWGEGKIQSQEGISGFRDCYNVNHQYQLVSNGPDKNKKIPNRIPTISYTNCDTSSYIEDNSVKIVTLMGAPINKSCAKDMARMVNGDVGKVVAFGFSSTSPDARNLKEELEKKNMFYCHGYQLPDNLKGLTLFDGTEYRAFLNVTDLKEELYKNIATKAYENAIDVSRTLETSKNGAQLNFALNKLLKEGNKNILNYAYKISTSDMKDILKQHLPVAFRLLFNADNVRLINKMSQFALKLVANAESTDEGMATSENDDKKNEKALWRILPTLEKDEIYFKILNLEQGMFLAMSDGSGDRKVKGVLKDTDLNVQWNLEPLKVDDDIVFYIINRQFKQGLKLGDTVDSNGEKQPLGHDGSVYNHPDTYGWLIVPQ